MLFYIETLFWEMLFHNFNYTDSNIIPIITSHLSHMKNIFRTWSFFTFNCVFIVLNTWPNILHFKPFRSITFKEKPVGNASYKLLRHQCQSISTLISEEHRSRLYLTRKHYECGVTVIIQRLYERTVFPKGARYHQTFVNHV